MLCKIAPVFLAVLALIPACVFPQEPLLMSSASPPPPNPGFVLRKTVDEVRLTFTVTDSQRRSVLGLERGQIDLQDDQRPVTSITAFRSERGRPLQLALLIDASGSADKYFAAEQQAAVQFLDRVLRTECDRAFVAAFGNKMVVLDARAANGQQVASAVSRVHPGGVTALYDALISTYDRLAAGQVGPVRRAVILFSDGDDNNSYHAFTDAIEGALRSDVAIYAITLRERATRGDDILRQLARLTGGRTFIVKRPKELAAACEQIEQELRSQYTIAFRPGERDGRFHRVQVQVRGAKALDVRARIGYWAPRDMARRNAAR